MLIRHATERDMPAVLEIYNASIAGRTATADLQPVSLPDRLASFRRHDPDRRPLWVAEREGAIVGYCSFRDFYGRPAYDPTVEVALYVHGNYQRQGVGAALLKHGLRECPRLKVRTVLALVFTHNRASMRLFERLGFARWGLLPTVADLDGRWVDLAILGWQRDVDA